MGKFTASKNLGLIQILETGANPKSSSANHRKDKHGPASTNLNFMALEGSK